MRAPRPIAWTVLTLALVGCTVATSPTPEPSNGGSSPTAVPAATGVQPSVGSGSAPPLTPVPGSTGSPDTSLPSPTAAIEDPAVAAAKQMIEAVDLADAATVDEIGGTLRFSAVGEQAAREVLVSSSSTDALWAAIWVYASSGSDPAPLVSALDNADLSIRAMAAASLIALGDASGFAALQDSLISEEQLLGSRPPLVIRDYALQTLWRYVTEDGVPVPPETEEGIAAAASQWSDWLVEHRNDLSFDQTDGGWKLP